MSSSRGGSVSLLVALGAVVLCCGFDVVEPRAGGGAGGGGGGGNGGGGGGGLGGSGGGALDVDVKAGISRTPFGTWPEVFDAAPTELGAQIVAGMKGGR